MLLSAVVHLKALENGSLPANIAPAIHSEFLKWMPARNEFHESDERRPFTISNLQGAFQTGRGGYRFVESGQSARFRITVLKPIDVTFPEHGAAFTLSNVRFEVQKKSDHAGNWSHKSSYRTLVDQYDDPNVQMPSVIEVEFASPTTFHTGDKIHSPLPVPEAVFDSWLSRWKLYSPDGLPDCAQDLSLAQFGISKYRLETHGVRYGKAEWIGFEGTCSFRVFSDDRNTLKLANILADYSFYCGTGVKLSYGLGQTRRLPHKQP